MFTAPFVSCVTSHISHNTCHISHVTLKRKKKKSCKWVELDGGGSVINGATPSSLQGFGDQINTEYKEGEIILFRITKIVTT